MPLVAAAVTLVPVAAECGSPAELDRAHDTSLLRRQCRGQLPVLRAVAAEDVRHLERGSGHDCRLWPLRLRQ